MAHPDNENEIEKVRAYITEAKAEVDKLEIIPRTLTRYAFDSVALAAVSKAFAISKACLALLSSGFPDEAYGLSRSLVECAINLRYLTQDPTLRDQRTDDFIKYFWATKAYWLYQGLQQFDGKPEEQEIRNYAKQQGIDPNAKCARRHWSGDSGFVWKVTLENHPLDGPASSEHLKKTSYAVDYHQTSSLVHCSQPALDNYFSEEGNSFRVSPSSGKYDQPSQKTLFILVLYLHSAIAYALFGMNLERPATLNALFQTALNGLIPVPRLHR
jgi:uncharacterized protein DUF5677